MVSPLEGPLEPPLIRECFFEIAPYTKSVLVGLPCKDRVWNAMVYLFVGVTPCQGVVEHSATSDVCCYTQIALACHIRKLGADPE